MTGPIAPAIEASASMMDLGASVPIPRLAVSPILPAVSITARWAPLVLIVSGWLSEVPTKSLGGAVPALPVNVHEEEDIFYTLLLVRAMLSPITGQNNDFFVNLSIWLALIENQALKAFFGQLGFVTLRRM
jgi:hypothetical protein